MNIGYAPLRDLSPTLMEWVDKSRIKPHLSNNSQFIICSHDKIYFALANLSTDYRKKHVYGKYESYCTALYENLKPSFYLWCSKWKFNKIEIDMIFRCENLYFSMTRTIIVAPADIMQD